MRHRLTLLLSFGLATVAAGFPSTAPASTTAHVLRLAAAEDIQGLNPELVNQSVVAWLSEMTMAYLFRCGRDDRFIPELATELPTFANHGISADGRSITVHLRRGVRWSDGQPFDSGDVAFTIAVMNNAANNVITREGFDRIVKVDEPDRYTVVVHLRAPYANIVATLFSSSGGTAILPKHLLGSLPDINRAPYNQLPVGIGPFRYSAWKRGDSVEMEENPYYWRGRPKLDRVIYKIVPDRNTVLEQLQTGELDLWYPLGGAFLARVQAIPSIDVLREPSYTYNEIVLNVRNPALATLDVRHALLLATDRKTIVEKIAHGVGVLQDVSAPVVDPDVPKNIGFTKYDPAAGNAILDKAGWVRGSDGIRAKNGVRLSFELASGSGLPDVDTQIELLRTFWKDIGVEISVRRYQSSLLFASKADGGILFSGKFDLALVAWSVNLPVDPANLLDCRRFPPDGQNLGFYCNPKLTPLFDDMHATYDQRRYRTDLAKILTIVAHDDPVIVQNGRENIFGYNKGLENFHPNSATPFDDMMDVDMKSH